MGRTTMRVTTHTMLSTTSNNAIKPILNTKLMWVIVFAESRRSYTANNP